jgi:thiol-disulfide isomerase/thioredoxin
MAFLARTSPAALTLLLVAVGALLGYGAYLASQSPAERLPPGDVRYASKGEAFDVKEHLAAGKYTIFDFYADWCAPCRALDPQLRRLASRRPDVAVRKVDIVDWESAVVKQFRVTSLPHMQVYDPNGALLAEGEDAYRVIADVLTTEIF